MGFAVVLKSIGLLKEWILESLAVLTLLRLLLMLLTNSAVLSLDPKERRLLDEKEISCCLSLWFNSI